MHSFTGSLEEMKKLVELGLHIGINGCSLKTEENLQVVKEIPKDRLMLETGIRSIWSVYYVCYDQFVMLDAPWCDIRPTHASFKHLANLSESEKAFYAPPSRKKEKFEMGCMVKGRCEPCSIGYRYS